jgi:MFS family permease
VSQTRHPLRETAFRSLWSGYLVSNLGTWAQSVGGAWLMTSLTTDALPVALMQTATTLPAFLVGVPAGSLADRVDRRRLLLVTQTWMLIAAGALAVLTISGLVSQWSLLGLTFALGLGSAIASPTFASLIPDVVSRPQVAAAVSINSLAYNVARAVGPSLGGALVAAIGPASTFVANTVSFLVPLAVLKRWRPAASLRPASSGEPFVRSMQAGLFFARQDKHARVVLTRSILWMLGASALWSLLPLVARRELQLEAPGYGFLVTCVGGGAILGALVLPTLRRTWPTNWLLIGEVVSFAAMLLALAWVRVLPVVWLMLALGGAAWTQSNQNFQIAIQLSAPAWVRARAIALYLLTFQGGQAIGSTIWGSVADRVGNPLALTVAAGAVAAGVLAALRWPVEDAS